MLLCVIMSLGTASYGFEVKPPLAMSKQAADCLQRSTRDLSNAFGAFGSSDAQASLVLHHNARTDRGYYGYGGVLKVEGVPPSEPISATLRAGSCKQLQDLARATGQSVQCPSAADEVGDWQRWLTDNGWHLVKERQVGYLPYYCDYLQSDSATPRVTLARAIPTDSTKFAYSFVLRVPLEMLAGEGWLSLVHSKIRVD